MIVAFKELKINRIKYAYKQEGSSNKTTPFCIFSKQKYFSCKI